MWKQWFGKKNKKESGLLKDASSQTLQAAIVTDLGNIRTNNEDTALFFRIADPVTTHSKGSLILVADGMGGHAAGEVASRMAADIISREYFHHENGQTGVEKSLLSAFRKANKQIYESAADDPKLRGMGTTCTAIVVKQDEIYFAHAGDSRAYFIKEKQINQVTTDHTYVQELLKQGNISAAEAAVHPQRNVLTNAMGTKPELRVDAGKYAQPLTEQDVLLLCSDGLYDYLEDQVMATMILDKPLQEAAEALVAEAKKRGGHDNITVLLARIEAAERTIERPTTKEYALPVTKEIERP